MPKIITVTSGKGGVGKTNVSVNLAVYLSQQGYRTCLFDADLGLANINILLGIYPEYNLEDVIDGKKELKDIIVHDKNGIDIIPGSSGIAKMETLTAQQLNSLAAAFGKLEDYDYLIFDTSAGISKNVVAFCMNASEVILIITPEPTSLTDAYALMKILSMNGFNQSAKVVVNQSKNPKSAQIAFTKLKDTVLKFLGIQLVPLGTIVSDAKVVEAVVAQKPFISLYPLTHASKGMRTIAQQVLDNTKDSKEVFAFDTFFQKCLDILTIPLKLPPKKGAEAPKTDVPSDSAASISAPSSSKPSKEPPTQVTSPPGQTTIHGDETTQRLLEQLVEKVTAVSQELSGIRMALEQGRLTEVNTTGTETRSDTTPPIIPLDFESFLAEQESAN